MGVLDGKTAVVTGGASGIGRAAARLFAAEGAYVVAADRADGVGETVDLLRADGGRGEALVGDVAAREVIEDAVARAHAQAGRLDVMYANAGVSGGLVGLFDLTAEMWAEILRINTTGVFLAVQAAARR